MSCKAYREMLHSYANNELSKIQQSTISEHLKSCEACSNELAEINILKQMLRTLKPEGFQIDEIKNNIMSTIIKNKKKTTVYDITVLTKMGAGMIACGLIAMLLNFTSFGDGMTQYTGYISPSINQPMTFINKELTNISNSIFSLDGIMFSVGEKIKGGM